MFSIGAASWRPEFQTALGDTGCGRVPEATNGCFLGPRSTFRKGLTIGQLWSGSTVSLGSALDGRFTEITAAEQSLTVGYRGAALRRLTDSTHC